MKKLLDAAGGLTRIVTFAPEVDSGLHVTRMLARDGIVVSAGHTNASIDLLNGALDNGLSMFTHLGNGCPVTMNRHDNIIQRVTMKTYSPFPLPNPIIGIWWIVLPLSVHRTRRPAQRKGIPSRRPVRFRRRA